MKGVQELQIINHIKEDAILANSKHHHLVHP